MRQMTEEQKKAIGARLAAARAAKKGAVAVDVAVAVTPSYVRPNADDPRLAKARMIQGGMIAKDPQAVAVLEERKAVTEMGWFDVRVNGNQEMAVVNRPCWCGAGRKIWHKAH